MRRVTRGMGAASASALCALSWAAACTYAVPSLTAADGGPTQPPSDGAPGPRRDVASEGASSPPDALSLPDAPGPDAIELDGPDVACSSQGIVFQRSYLFEPSATTRRVTILAAPTVPAAGDVLVAYLALSGSFTSGSPTITPSGSWTLVGRGDSPTPMGTRDSALAVYVAVVGADEASLYTFTLGAAASVVAWVLDYSGVDVQEPVDVQAFAAQTFSATTLTSPFVTTTGPNEVVIASYGMSGVAGAELDGPVGLSSRAYANGQGSESGASWDVTQNMPSGVGGYTFGVPSSQTPGLAIVHLLALRRCQ